MKPDVVYTPKKNTPVKRPLPAHHQAWLESHPNRSEDWFRRMIEDGFHVHHLDEDHSNNSPDNLCLVGGTDHQRLHKGMAWQQAPFDRTAYQREYMRQYRARQKATKNV